MNRSALVIKMLHILYGRNKPISREELADLLECNIRNISEYKKELEIAGYSIDSISGKYGGYILNEKSIFPSLTLNKEEKLSLQEALGYLENNNFNYYKDFESAMNKLMAKLKSEKRRETIYLQEGRKRLNEDENTMLNSLYKAIEERLMVEMNYISDSSKNASKRLINPYEVIINKDGFYVLAQDYTPKKQIGFKFFKITEERMKEVVVLNRHFYRNEDFKVSDYIGKHTLLKQLQEAKLKISGISTRLVNEMEIENIVEKYFIEDDLYIHFFMEGNYRLKQFILSLGSDCEVLQPLELQEEIKEELEKMIKKYCI